MLSGIDYPRSSTAPEEPASPRKPCAQADSVNMGADSVNAGADSVNAGADSFNEGADSLNVGLIPSTWGRGFRTGCARD